MCRCFNHALWLGDFGGWGKVPIRHRASKEKGDLKEAAFPKSLTLLVRSACALGQILIGHVLVYTDIAGQAQHAFGNDIAQDFICTARNTQTRCPKV